MRGIVGLVGVALAALALGLGVLAGSVLVALLVCGGFYLVWAGFGAVEMRRYRWAWLAIVTGVVITVDAMWLGDMGGRWLWPPTLLLMGLTVVVAGSSAWPDSRGHGKGLVAVGSLVMLFAVLAPFVVYPALAPEGAATGGATTALSAALRAAVTSLWAWLGLAVLALLGAAVLLARRRRRSHAETDAGARGGRTLGDGGRPGGDRETRRAPRATDSGERG